MAAAAVAGFSAGAGVDQREVEREQRAKEARISRLARQMNQGKERRARQLEELLERYAGSKDATHLDALQVRALLQDLSLDNSAPTDDEVKIVCLLCRGRQKQQPQRRQPADPPAGSDAGAGAAAASSSDPGGGGGGGIGVATEQLGRAIQVWEEFQGHRPVCVAAMQKYDANRSGRLEREELRAFLAGSLGGVSGGISGSQSADPRETGSEEGPKAEVTVGDDALDFVLQRADLLQRGGVSQMELLFALEEWNAYVDGDSRRCGTSCSLM